LEKKLEGAIMRIVLIADAFPPLKNSASALVLSLAEALAELGHELVVITPTVSLEGSYQLENCGAFKVLRINCGNIKQSKNKFIRGIGELLLFFTLPMLFKKTPYSLNEWDAIIWYSPTIFLSRLVKSLRRRKNLSYLILRDIFPDWMIDIGLMNKGLSYFILRWFERYQYRQADFIGVQSDGNMHYIERLNLPQLKKIEVLPNWMPSGTTDLSSKLFDHESVNLQNTILRDKTILVYAGNLGEAQGIENFVHLILEMKNDQNIGFLIIGRGAKKAYLEANVATNQVNNVLILDEMNLNSVRLYYRQSTIGLVFLDPNHKSHNIPGKFISYLEAGLPVAALVNKHNDLIANVRNFGLGVVGDTPVALAYQIRALIKQINAENGIGQRARSYYEANHRPKTIAQQILGCILR